MAFQIKKPVAPALSGQSPATTQATEVVFPSPEFFGSSVESRIPEGFEGLTVITGGFGSGKTIFSLGIDHPENVLFLDYETKGKLYAKSLGIENYYSVGSEGVDLLGMDFSPIHLFQRTAQILLNIPRGRFTTLVLDGNKILQEGLIAEVSRDPAKYGVRPMNVEKNVYGGANPGATNIYIKFLSIAQAKGIRVVALTTELADKWVQGAPVLNKFEVSGVKALKKFSILTVLLVKGYDDIPGAPPSALVLKESLGLPTRDGSVLRRLPPKLPIATPSEVYRYMSSPANWEKLDPRELPSKEELEPFSMFIPKAQLGMLQSYFDAIRDGKLVGVTDNEEEG